MTDLPAVIYLKDEISRTWTEQEACESPDDQFETNISKKPRKIKNITRPQKQIDSCKKLLELMNNAVSQKMNKIETSLEILLQNSEKLERKIDALSSSVESSTFSDDKNNVESSDSSKQKEDVPNFSKVTPLTLYTEDDFPDGSWLGFENDPEKKVRCKIKLCDLQKINDKCCTATKMALTLLDHLFDKETQAVSNISGLGKHKKKQLDPVLIYGIRCHLMHYFDIDEDEWAKIKIHMDSKCRTAFRNKSKGTPLSSKLSKHAK